MIKKMMLLAVSAAAVIAFAVPAAASANWTHSGSELAEDATVSFSGPASFSVGEGAAGWSWEIHAKLELTAGTTAAHVLTFEDSDCTGFGQLANLTCTGTPEGLPWTAHIDPETGDIRITNIKLTNHYYSPLDAEHANPLTTTVLTGNILASPETASAISSVSLSGENTFANGWPATVEGTLSASEPGTYGTE